MEKQLQIVSFEQAKKLKELGFDWFDNTDRQYLSNGDFVYESEGDAHIDMCTDKCYHAPTTALALKWLRDEKKIIAYTQHHYFEDYNFIVFEEKYNDGKLIESSERGYTSHEEAESAGLDYALDYLLKEKK